MKNFKEFEKKKKADQISILSSTVDELQEVCDFGPPLKPDGKDVLELIEMIKKAGSFLDAEDELSDDTVIILTGLLCYGKDNKFAPQEVDAEEIPKAKKEQKEETEEEWNLEEEIEKAKTLKDLKELVKNNTELEALRSRLASYSSKASLKSVMIKYLNDEIEIKEEKKAPAKESKAPGSASAGKTEFGHSATSQAGAIDIVLLKHKNKFVAETVIAEECETSTGRIRSHVKHLQRAKGQKIELKKEDNVTSYKLEHKKK